MPTTDCGARRGSSRRDDGRRSRRGAGASRSVTPHAKMRHAPHLQRGVAISRPNGTGSRQVRARTRLGGTSLYASARSWPDSSAMAVHDAVGQQRDAPCPAASRHTPRTPIGAPKRTRDLGQPREPGPDRLDVLGADERRPARSAPARSAPARRPRCGPGRAGRPAIGCPRGRCRTRRRPEHLERRVEALLRGRRRVPVDRAPCPTALKKPLRRNPPTPVPVQYSSLARKRTWRGDGERDREGVDERQVVARDDDATAPGDVLLALDRRPVQHAAEGLQDDVSQPVEHAPTLVAARGGDRDVPSAGMRARRAGPSVEERRGGGMRAPSTGLDRPRRRGSRRPRPDSRAASRRCCSSCAG